MIKKIRTALIIFIGLFLLLFFSGYIFFSKSLIEETTTTSFIPNKRFALYIIEGTGEVTIHMFHVMILAFVLTIPVYFILQLIQKLFNRFLYSRGNQ
ncbi:uncharacterized membrane protein YcaP (DUF421 family) [Bacillus thermophilus]|uniref:Uncharacterized membrane protein YcaP (DUF421 family) n=1 Tax=Siminovitchia thermophila TaxID=1245522 RepID=A0ABS2R0T0_9BACI|nr:hypothetical protein [Siminovitchia thermophila]MBM7713246.1 uncharacterized membrane protein YcaP (DUF421 family) [Siminovitchia thermophila]ONK25239.1 hypothetical protein BLX87_00860 [Bacillus sp. VT-16-64]